MLANKPVHTILSILSIDIRYEGGVTHWLFTSSSISSPVALGKAGHILSSFLRAIVSIMQCM